MKGTTFAWAACLSIALGAVGAGAAGIKEGNWSMTTTVRMQGMDAQAAEAMKEMENMSPEDRAMMEQMMGGMGMTMGAASGGMGMTTTTTQCITGENPVPEADPQAEDCKQSHSLNGDTVDFEVVCENSRSTGRVTYTGDSMSGTITSVHSEGGQEQQVTIDITGKYAGPCT